MTEGTEPTPEKKKPVIICVDDEKFVLDTLDKQLQRRFGDQYEYEQAESAEEAIEVIGELIEEGYDIMMVISDQIMPGMSGDQLLTYIHKNNPKPIKILLTGQGSLDSAINVINNASLYRYLTKPWKEDDFLLTVEHGLRQYMLHEKTINQATVFSQFVPKEFLECLSKDSITDIKLGDQVQREMAVLFSDIRGFTSISENMTPEENYAFINNYLAYVQPAIQGNGGFVDKYIGDAVMALFYRAEDAVAAAVDMQREIEVFNDHNRHKPYAPLKSGVGVHIGSLMLGIVGVPTRLQGTVISDVVNVASRLQTLTRTYDNRIIISDEVLQGMDGSSARFPTRFLGKIRVKGKQNVTSIFEVLDTHGDSTAIKKLASKAEFNKGIELYFKRQFAEASVHFNGVLGQDPGDKVARLFLERSASYMVQGVAETWDGVETQSLG